MVVVYALHCLISCSQNHLYPQMLQTAAVMFSEKEPKHHIDIKQLLIILSDGRGVFSEGETVYVGTSIIVTGSGIWWCGNLNPMAPSTYCLGSA